MKKIHKDYQEIIVFTIVFTVVFLITVLADFLSNDTKNMLSDGLKYFWLAGILSIIIVTFGVAVNHAIKKRIKVMDEKPNEVFYSYWPYEHPPWM